MLSAPLAGTDRAGSVCVRDGAHSTIIECATPLSSHFVGAAPSSVGGSKEMGELRTPRWSSASEKSLLVLAARSVQRSGGSSARLPPCDCRAVQVALGSLRLAAEHDEAAKVEALPSAAVGPRSGSVPAAKQRRSCFWRAGRAAELGCPRSDDAFKGEGARNLYLVPKTNIQIADKTNFRNGGRKCANGA